MPHINLPTDLPGISAGFAFRPETAAPMRELAHILLFEPGPEASLSSRDRELIASYVSAGNSCYFCQTSHGAAASHHVNGSWNLTDAVCANPQTADISPKLRALLAVADRVRENAQTITSELIVDCRRQGATDLDIHDTVLIAAAFCMYNRYVDGLATLQPRDRDMYDTMGQRLATVGYRK